MDIKNLTNPDEKSTVCNNILRALPDWFEIESAIIDYVGQVRKMPFYTAFDKNRAVGFAAVKIHNRYTAEICVIGVLPDYHRQGIGKALIAHCEEYCKSNNIEFLTVKTLDESREDEGYEKTRLFYLSVGFKPLEVFPLFWDKDNPCLFMAKCVSCALPNKRSIPNE